MAILPLVAGVSSLWNAYSANKQRNAARRAMAPVVASWRGTAEQPITPEALAAKNRADAEAARTFRNIVGLNRATLAGRGMTHSSVAGGAQASAERTLADALARNGLDFLQANEARRQLAQDRLMAYETGQEQARGQEIADAVGSIGALANLYEQTRGPRPTTVPVGGSASPATPVTPSVPVVGATLPGGGIPATFSARRTGPAAENPLGARPSGVGTLSAYDLFRSADPATQRATTEILRRRLAGPTVPQMIGGEPTLPGGRMSATPTLPTMDTPTTVGGGVPMMATPMRDTGTMTTAPGMGVAGSDLSPEDYAITTQALRAAIGGTAPMLAGTTGLPSNALSSPGADVTVPVPSLVGGGTIARALPMTTQDTMDRNRAANAQIDTRMNPIVEDSSYDWANLMPIGVRVRMGDDGMVRLSSSASGAPVATMTRAQYDEALGSALLQTPPPGSDVYVLWPGARYGRQTDALAPLRVRADGPAMNSRLRLSGGEAGAPTVPPGVGVVVASWPNTSGPEPLAPPAAGVPRETKTMMFDGVEWPFGRTKSPVFVNTATGERFSVNPNGDPILANGTLSADDIAALRALGYNVVE